MKDKTTEMTIPFDTEQVVEESENSVFEAKGVTKPEYINSSATILEERVKDEEEKRKIAKKEVKTLYGAAAYKQLFGSSHAPEEPKRRPAFIRDISEPAPLNARTAAGHLHYQLLPLMQTM